MKESHYFFPERTRLVPFNMSFIHFHIHSRSVEKNDTAFCQRKNVVFHFDEGEGEDDGKDDILFVSLVADEEYCFL